MKIENIEIRDALKANNVKYWWLAHKFGITDQTLSRRLRIEFSPEDKTLALAYIKELAKEN